jgi:signal peptidase I
MELEELWPASLKKNVWDYGLELVISLSLALVIAVLIRQMWFEPMEIPSGSMRPTFQELDRLFVTKTTFGINIPLLPAHFYFDPSLVQRTGVFIFTSENLDIPDQNTTYFGFPSKRRLIKRCMGNPGDILYFYGGKIYGIDAEGNDLPELRDSPWILSHVPFISFEGKVSETGSLRKGGAPSVTFYQMHEPLARLSLLPTGEWKGELRVNGQWQAETATGEGIHRYGDFFGMRNYAMARLVNREQALQLSKASTDLPQAPLYLELRHFPSLTYPQPQLALDEQGRLRPSLVSAVSLIPLTQEHINSILASMTTCRFIVREGKAYPDRQDGESFKHSPYRPSFLKVPDGRYQFDRGVAYRVAFGGILRPLPLDHPLYSHSVEQIQRLFNVGVEMISLFDPQAHLRTNGLPFYPARYAYFREGDLFVLDTPLLKKEDPLLIAFVEAEQKRAANSSTKRPYQPFIDYGPPMKEGVIDQEFIRTFGFQVPKEQYLALGDNYASSGDSRVFGCVPEQNLQGTPSLIVWPPGPRWGRPAQPLNPPFTLSRLIIWGIAWKAVASYYSHKHLQRRRDRKLWKKQIDTLKG